MSASIVIKDDWYSVVDIKEENAKLVVENKKLVEENKTLKIALVFALQQSRHIHAHKIIL
jgi:hypothetical protein